MLSLLFEGPGNRSTLVKRSKIVAIREYTPDSDGGAQCLIFLEGVHEGFMVKGAFEKVMVRVREGLPVVDESLLQPGNEALLIFGKPEVPDPDVWRNMSSEARSEWNRRYTLSGMASFRCLTCSYPTATGQGFCESCRPEKERHEEDPDVVFA